MSIFKRKSNTATLEHPITINLFNAPWIFTDLNLLGLNETDAELIARLIPEWKYMHRASNYKSLSGTMYAWCALLVNALLRKVNLKGTNDPAAASFSTFGKACPFWFGCILPLRHKGGGRHVCFFLYWIDERKKIAATLDGNRGNRFCVAETDLSINGDTVVPSPRWPIAAEDGIFVLKEDVLKAYPQLKVGGQGSASTR